MKFKRFARGAAAFFTLSIGQSAAQAAPVELAAFGAFQNVATGAEAGHWLQNSDHVSDALLLWGAADAPFSSLLGFDGLGSLHKTSYVSAPVGTAFRIGRLGWRNGTPGGQATNVNGLELLLSVFVGADRLQDFVFGVRIDNTDDTGTKGVADQLKLFSAFDRHRFSAGGLSYSLEFLGFSFDGGANYTNRLTADENDGIKADLYALIRPLSLPPQPQAVPLPGALWLFGAGLAGLAGFARRR